MGLKNILKNRLSRKGVDYLKRRNLFLRGLLYRKGADYLKRRNLFWSIFFFYIYALFYKRELLRGLSIRDLSACKDIEGYKDFLEQQQQLNKDSRLLNNNLEKDFSYIEDKEDKETIVLLTCQFVCNDDKYIKSNFFDFFRDPLEEMGFKTVMLYVDQLSSDQLSPLQKIEEENKLVKQITSLGASFIFFDANGIYTGLYNILSKIESRKIRTLAIIGDAWSEDIIKVAQYWNEVTDAFFICCPLSPLRGLKDVQHKLCEDALPLSTKIFFPQTKTIDLSFVGSFYSHLREFFLSFVGFIFKENKYVTKIICHDRIQTSAVLMEEYGSIMRQSKIVLNFSSRGFQEIDYSCKVNTGRVFEAIACKSLLLCEDNPSTAAYFVPYLHYIPFNNLKSLIVSLKFFLKNPQLAEEIALKAYEFYMAHYQPIPIMKRILSHLKESKP
jgi:hypothetical protein